MSVPHKLTRAQAAEAAATFAALAAVAKETAAYAYGPEQTARLARVLSLIDEMLKEAEAALDAVCGDES